MSVLVQPPQLGRPLGGCREARADRGPDLGGDPVRQKERAHLDVLRQRAGMLAVQLQQSEHGRGVRGAEVGEIRPRQRQTQDQQVFDLAVGNGEDLLRNDEFPAQQSRDALRDDAGGRAVALAVRQRAFTRRADDGQDRPRESLRADAVLESDAGALSPTQGAKVGGGQWNVFRSRRCAAGAHITNRRPVRQRPIAVLDLGLDERAQRFVLAHRDGLDELAVVVDPLEAVLASEARLPVLAHDALQQLALHPHGVPRGGCDPPALYGAEQRQS